MQLLGDPRSTLPAHIANEGWEHACMLLAVGGQVRVVSVVVLCHHKQCTVRATHTGMLVQRHDGIPNDAVGIANFLYDNIQSIGKRLLHVLALATSTRCIGI
jgi:hypothetical protein